MHRSTPRTCCWWTGLVTLATLAPAVAAAPLSRVRDPQEFVHRVERAWKANDHTKIAAVAARRVFYANHMDTNDFVEVSGRARATFFERLLMSGIVDYDLARMDAFPYWREINKRPWKAKIVRERVPTGGSGYKGMDDYDAYLELRSADQTTRISIYLKQEGQYCRLRGFYRNSI